MNLLDKDIAQWLTTENIIGVSSIAALLLIYYQIRSSRNNAKVSRTIELVRRYHNDYSELRTHSTIERLAEYDEIPTPFTDAEWRIQHDKYTRNYGKKVDFYREVAMYWNRDLLDKEIVVHHFKEVITKEWDSLKRVKDSNPVELYPDMKAMLDDMKDMRTIDDKLKELYTKMNIR